jgi:hypothetical protein
MHRKLESIPVDTQDEGILGSSLNEEEVSTSLFYMFVSVAEDLTRAGMSTAKRI